MIAYQAVSSGYDISKKIADLLEDIDPIQYNGNNRARRVRNVNDCIQGRNDMPLDALLDWAAKADGGAYAERVTAIRGMIQALQIQKSLMEQPYPLPCTKERPYERYLDDPSNSVKVIDQKLFDYAAQAGFPDDFFRNSYFDHVTIYCLPDNTHCIDCVFDGCTFAACRMVSTEFEDTSLYSCEFHSCSMSWLIVSDSTMAHTHFYDCTQRRGGFIQTSMKNCSVLDCIMDGVRFTDSKLDGCSFDRVKASGIRNLQTTVVTQSGATEEECRRNREAIYKALRPEDHSQRLDRNLPGPER